MEVCLTDIRVQPLKLRIPHAAWPWQSGYCRLSPCAGCTPAASDTHSQRPRWSADPCGRRKKLIFTYAGFLNDPSFSVWVPFLRGQWSWPRLEWRVWAAKRRSCKEQHWHINNRQNWDQTEMNWALLSRCCSSSRASHFCSGKSSEKWEWEQLLQEGPPQNTQGLHLCSQTGPFATKRAQINSRFDVFDGRGPLVVYEAVVAVDDFFGLSRLVECRLHLDTDKLTHWRGQTDRQTDSCAQRKVLILICTSASSIKLVNDSGYTFDKVNESYSVSTSPTKHYFNEYPQVHNEAVVNKNNQTLSLSFNSKTASFTLLPSLFAR